MNKAMIVFIVSIILSSIFHFSTGGDALKFNNITVNISITDIVISLLLLSNLLVLILLLKKKK